MQRVFDAGFLFLHLGLGRGADVDDGHATGELRQAFLELLAVVIGGGLFDLTADLAHAALDVGLLAVAFHDGGVFLVDRDALGAAEVLELDVLELDAEVFGDALAAGEDGDVFEHRLAAIAEARGLDGATCSVPRSLFTTRVASASPSTSSAMMRSGFQLSRLSRAAAAGPSSS